MADPNTPNPPPRQQAQGSSQGGMMVPTPPLGGQTINEDEEIKELSDATKAEREAGQVAMKQNQDRTSREQEAGRKAMRSGGNATPGARPRPQQPPTQANQPQGRPNPLHGTPPQQR